MSEEVVHSFEFGLMDDPAASGVCFAVVVVCPKHTGANLQDIGGRLCMASGMGTSCTFDIVTLVLSNLWKQEPRMSYSLTVWLLCGNSDAILTQNVDECICR